MKRDKKKTNDNLYIKLSLFLSLFFVAIIMFMSVGYALYTQVINVSGNVALNTQGSFKISNVRKVLSSNTSEAIPSWTDNSINFNLSFIKSDEEDPTYSASYDVTVSNDTFFERLISSFNFNFTITDGEGEELGVLEYEVENFQHDDVLDALSEKTYRVNFTFTPSKDSDIYDVVGEGTIDSVEKAYGDFSLHSISPTTGSIKDNNLQRIVISLNSTYESNRVINIVCNSDKVEVVDSNGSPIGSFTLSANSQEQEFIVYLKAKDDALFPDETYTTSLSVTSSGLPSLSLGNITLAVDKHEEYVDSYPPVISNVVANMSNEVGTVDITWSGTDDFSGIDSYTILVLRDNEVINTFDVGNVNNYTINGLSTEAKAYTYNFKVYGKDLLGNTASSDDINNCSTASGYCSMTGDNSYQWVFNVTRNLNNINFNGASTVNIGSDYTATLTATLLYNLPETITVTMGGVTLTSGYTYNANNGSLTINNVTGDIVISGNANAICIVEGTKVLLANNKYKNVEEIKYDDLLAVWDYNTGKLTYQYPIWIERTSVVDSYQKTTFNDGTSLSTSGDHAVYSMDLGMFVSIEDRSVCNIGSTIAKIENGKIKKVKITKIETIKKRVKLYHIISTSYYNIIAADVLTTDRTLMISNLYGFTDKITWPNNIRNNFIKDSNNLYKYSDFKDIMPYYMFKGLRIGEGKYLVDHDFISLDGFKYYLIAFPANPEYYKKVEVNNKGKRLWMVTTSIDKVNDHNKNKYKVEEGSYYVFKKHKNVVKYCNSIDNTCYRPGEKIKVYTGMHFIAKK